MVFHPWRLGGCVLLAGAGWMMGRWTPPGGAAPTADQLRIAGGSPEGMEAARRGADKALPGAPGAEKAQSNVDGKAAGLAMRASGDEGHFRDRARQMALEPPPALTDFLEAVTDSEILRATLLEDAAVWAFNRNPEKGLALLSSLPDSPETAVLTRKALRFFPPKDLPLLRNWYAGMPDSKRKVAALKEMLPALCRGDFGGTVALVAALPQHGEEAQTLRMGIMQRLLAKHAPDTSYDGMLAAVERFPEQDRQSLKEWVQLEELRRLNFGNKEELAGRLTGLPPEARASWTATVFEEWAGSDPLRAAPQLEALPDDLKTEQVYTGFAKKWATGNVGMASQWVKDLPEGPPRQAAVKGLAAGLTRDYPVEALTWAATLADPAGRRSAIQSVLDGAAAEFRPELEGALQKQPLSPEEKATLNFPASP